MYQKSNVNDILSSCLNNQHIEHSVYGIVAQCNEIDYLTLNFSDNWTRTNRLGI